MMEFLKGRGPNAFDVPAVYWSNHILGNMDLHVARIDYGTSGSHHDRWWRIVAEEDKFAQDFQRCPARGRRRTSCRDHLREVVSTGTAEAAGVHRVTDGTVTEERTVRTHLAGVGCRVGPPAPPPELSSAAQRQVVVVVQLRKTEDEESRAGRSKKRLRPVDEAEEFDEAEGVPEF